MLPRSTHSMVQRRDQPFSSHLLGAFQKLAARVLRQAPKESACVHLFRKRLTERSKRWRKASMAGPPRPSALKDPIDVFGQLSTRRMLILRHWQIDWYQKVTQIRSLRCMSLGRESTYCDKQSPTRPACRQDVYSAAAPEPAGMDAHDAYVGVVRRRCGLSRHGNASDLFECRLLFENRVLRLRGACFPMQ